MPSTNTSLAERQVRQQKAEDVHAKALRGRDAELERLRAEVRKLSESKGRRGGVEEAAGVEMDCEEYEYTIEQLVEQRRLLKAQGKDDEHADVASLTTRVKSQQQQRLAAKPGAGCQG